jgi:hypothetical protein
VATDRRHLYVAVGTTIHVYQLRAGQPARPLGVVIRMPAPVTGLEAAGGRMLVELGGTAVRAVDISDPSQPRVGSPLAGPMGVDQAGSRIALGADGVAFVALGSGWRAFDIEDPVRPRPLATMQTPGPLRGIALDHGHLYAIQQVPEPQRPTVFDSQLVAWDVTRPSEPVAFGEGERLMWDRWQVLVDAYGGRVMLADRGQILGVTAPRDGPWVVDSGRTASRVSHVDLDEATYVVQVVSTGDTRLFVMDPTGHRPAIGIALESDRLQGWDARDVHVGEGQLFVVSAHHGVLVFELDDPLRPTRVGPPLAAFGGSVADVSLDRGLAWVATERGLRLLRLDRGDPPQLLAEHATAGTALAVGADGGRGIVGTWRLREQSGGDVVESAFVSVLHVLDARDPEQPMLLQAIERDGIPRDVVVEGRRAFVAHRPGAVVAIDLGVDDEPPRAVAKLMRSGLELEQLILDGDRLWVTFHNRTFGVGPGAFGLVWWDVGGLPVTPLGTMLTRRPATTSVLPPGATRGTAFGIWRPKSVGADDMGFVPAAAAHGVMIDLEGMHVLEPSTSASLPGLSLDRRASLDLPLRALSPALNTPAFTPQRTDLVMRDGIAWIAAADAGLRAMDIRLPDRPDESAWLTGPTTVVAVDAAGPLVVVAAGEDGLLVLRWTGWEHEDRLWLPVVHVSWDP